MTMSTDARIDFLRGVRHAAQWQAAWAKSKGWDMDRSFGDEIALLHSEVSEALEEFRDRGPARYYRDDAGKVRVLEHDEPYPPGAKPLGVPSEMADILVRLLDTCNRYDIDLASEFLAKMTYNERRAYRHGNKAL